LVIIGGLAELVSGSISMGLGAYLAAVTERDHYDAELKREWQEVRERPADEMEEIYEIIGNYGVSREATKPLVEALQRNPDMWIKVNILQFFSNLDHRILRFTHRLTIVR